MDRRVNAQLLVDLSRLRTMAWVPVSSFKKSWSDHTGSGELYSPPDFVGATPWRVLVVLLLALTKSSAKEALCAASQNREI